ncbi:hypothetical protein JTB14_018989 [Gonioctena quinquepunctata]|nr:hypothetical protein JTB14_018989 [Gonioctena quinquepunctata]
MDQTINGFIFKQHQNLELIRKSRIKAPPIVRKFFINWKMVPLFINDDTAESILFMGRIVWILKNDPKKCLDENYRIRYERDIWEGKDLDYYKRLQNLESETFNNIEFQSTLEECRIKLTKDDCLLGHSAFPGFFHDEFYACYGGPSGPKAELGPRQAFRPAL